MQKKETICRSQAINHFSMLSYRLLWWFSHASRIKSGSVSLSGLRQRLLCIKINGAKFHGNIINHNKAFEKRTSPPPRNRLNLSEYAGKITRLRDPSRTPSWMSENRWTVFSHEFQSIIARIQAKNNENLSVLTIEFSRELRHVNSRKQCDVSRPLSWMSAWSQPTETLTRICHTFLAFRTVSCFQKTVFGL